MHDPWAFRKVAMIQYKPKALSTCKEHSRWGGGEGLGEGGWRRRERRKGRDVRSVIPTLLRCIDFSGGRASWALSQLYCPTVCSGHPLDQQGRRQECKAGFGSRSQGRGHCPDTSFWGKQAKITYLIRAEFWELAPVPSQAMRTETG